MNVYVVFTHPNPDSFNAAVRERLVQGLRDAGHLVELSDLYAEGFSPVLTGPELADLTAGKTAADVLPYQEKIRRAEALVFIYPIWWFSPPALLKGWLDRVLSRGFAYDMGPMGLMPKLKNKKALLVCTAGGMEAFYKNFGFTEAMKKVLLTGTIQFCGIAKVSQVVFHNVVAADAATRQGYLEEAYRLGKEL